MSTVADDDVYDLVMAVATSTLSVEDIAAALQSMHGQATDS